MSRIVIDLDDPEIPPLALWLEMLRIVRIRHEYARDMSAVQAAIRLSVHRTTVFRVLSEDARRKLLAERHSSERQLRKDPPNG